jgi:putative SOS response-associated peptidase YedK
MCGRFKLDTPPLKVKDHFGLAALEAFPPRYNIAPTQPILIVVESPVRERPGRLPMLARWGLIPAFAKDPRDVPLLFNARAETAGERNAFRAALRHRRCLIPASGFYEWQKRGKGRSQPFLVTARDGGLFAFAGLMETFLAADGSEIDTATILTTSANAALADIHERMPVIVPPGGYARWLDCRSYEPKDVADLLRPAPEDLLQARAVSEAVNKVANMSPRVQEPPEGGGQGSFGF